MRRSHFNWAANQATGLWGSLLLNRSRLTTLGLKIGLGLGSSAIAFWVMPEAIAPPPAAAYVIIQNLEMQGRPGDTYNSFLTRAQTVAATAVQRYFEQDLLATEVSLTVNGRNNSTVVAVLRLRVTRRDWQRYPDARYWTIYFANAQTLLGFPRGGSPAPAPTPLELPDFPE